MYIYFISSAMGKTRKVNKRFSFANNLILENDLELLSGRLYTDINGIVFILGLGLFISLVNCIFLLSLELIIAQISDTQCNSIFIFLYRGNLVIDLFAKFD